MIPQNVLQPLSNETASAFLVQSTEWAMQQKR